MFDCALHFRFLQKATEAMFEAGQASVAAALACQKRIYDGMTPEKLGPAEPVRWGAWFGDWTPVARAPVPVQPDLMQSWAAMANAYSSYWQGGYGVQAPPVLMPAARAPASAQADLMQSWMAMANACSAYWQGGCGVQAPPVMAMVNASAPASFEAFWGVTPWTFYQGPMVAMMLSYGVPYAVAAPTARASTSAMDAADAACAQWRLVFGSSEGQKSLDRNTRRSSRQAVSYLH